MKIYFQSEAECNYFKHLIAYNHLFYKETKHKRKGYELFVAHIPLQILLTNFIKVYLVFRLSKKIKEIARNIYYYSNKTEIEQIVEWTYFLLQEKSFMDDQFNESSLFDYLYYTLLKQFQQMPTTTEIYYDMFILFQFKQFHEQLIDIVGFAIDEMKREEEYQHYLHTIREYIHFRKPKRSTLHVLQRSPFEFFDHQGNKISDLQVTRLMRNEPLYLIGLDEKERNLAPIVTLLPELLYIYGNDVNEPKTVTLLNVFQERAKFLPESSFPFSLT